LPVSFFLSLCGIRQGRRRPLWPRDVRQPAGPGRGPSPRVQRDQQLVTVTDQDGVFRFAAIGDGAWSIRVEMIGFRPASQEITVGADAPASAWALTLLPLDEMTRGLSPTPATTVRLKPDTTEPAPGQPAESRVAKPDATGTSPAQPGGSQAATPGTASAPAGFQRAQVNASAGGATLANDPIASGDADRSSGAADGFLINGSVNNGAASPFAQLAAFGNNRRNVRSLYNGGLGVLLGSSALDARPFSFTGQPAAKPSYSDAQIVGSFAGPLKIPGLLTRGPNLFLGYQRTVDHKRERPVGPRPDGAGARGRFLAITRRPGTADPARGSRQRPSAYRQCDSIIAPQSAGRRAAQLLPAAESRRARALQLSGARARDAAPGRRPGAIHGRR